MSNLVFAVKHKTWIPLFIGILVLVLWTVYWVFGANWMKQKAEAEIEKLVGQGYDVSTQNLQVTGWPYRFMLEVSGLEIVLPAHVARGRAFVPTVRIHAMAWQTSHLIVEFPDGGQFRTNSDQDLQYNSTRTRASLVFLQGEVSRLSIEMLTPKVQTSSGDIRYLAEQIDLHIRAGTNTDSRNVFVAAIGPVWPRMPLKPISHIKLNAEVFSWLALLNEEGLAGFRQANGHLIVHDALLSSGSASGEFSGTLHIDQNGFLAGQVKTKFIQPAELLAKLDQDQMNNDAKKTMVALRVLTGGVGTTELSFKLKKGRVYSGPFRIAKAPRILH